MTRFQRSVVLLASIGALLPFTSVGQIWISPTDTSWHVPGNWTSVNIPDNNNEIAVFNSGAFANPQITSNITIQRLQVTGNYILSGDTGSFTIDSRTTVDERAVQLGSATNFTLDRDVTVTNSWDSITGRVEVPAGSTFTFASGNTWTSGFGIAFNDVATVSGGTFNFDGALALGGNFVQVFNAFTSVNGGTLNFNPSSVTASAGGKIQNIGGRGRLNLLSDFTNAFIEIGNNAFAPGFSPSETYLAKNGMSMSRNVQVALANSLVFGTTVVHQYGVDIPGSGTATQAGSITLGNGGVGTESYKIALDVKTDDTMIVTGSIQGGTGLRPGVVQTLAKTGPGTLVLAGAAANTWTAPFNIEAGTVILNKDAAGTNAIPNVTVTISGGELQLGKSDQIINTADLTLAGGTFDTAGFSESLDRLTITLASNIDFGSGSSVLNFTTFVSGSGVLTIDGWSGSLTGGGSDRFIVGNPAAILGYLPNIHFTGFPTGAAVVGNEIVPVPEPSTAGLLLSVAVGLGLRRRRRQS